MDINIDIDMDIDINMDIDMETDNNVYTLEERDVDDNEEGMIRDMRLLLLRISTWTVEGRRPCRLHQPSQRRGLQKDHFEMKHQKES